MGILNTSDVIIICIENLVMNKTALMYLCSLNIEDTLSFEQSGLKIE